MTNRLPKSGSVWAVVIGAFLLGIVIILLGSLAETHNTPLLAIFLIALGTLFSGSIALSIVFEAVLSETHARQVKDHLRQVLDSSLRGIKFSGVNDGVHTVERKDDAHFRDLFASLSPADELLWLDTSGPKMEWYSAHLRDLLQRGLQVRMLLLDPNSVNATNRAIESTDQFHLTEGEQSQSINLFQAEANRQIFALQQLATSKGRDPSMIGSMKIALYDDLPGVPLYLVRRDGHPSRAWTSFYLNDATYLQVHFEWVYVGDDCMLQRFADYFERKWDRTIKHTDRLVVDIG